MRTTNLLPWRKRRQQRCLRLWGLLFAGSLLLALSLFLRGRTEPPGWRQAAPLWLASETRVRQALARRHQEWTVLRARYLREQQWVQRKNTTLGWQPWLLSLANMMPEQAWLTRLRFQHATLELTGYAATLPALASLEQALRRVPGFTLGPAGEMRQDSQGRWQFSYPLVKQEVADATSS